MSWAVPTRDFLSKEPYIVAAQQQLPPARFLSRLHCLHRAPDADIMPFLPHYLFKVESWKILHSRSIHTVSLSFRKSRKSRDAWISLFSV